MSYKLTLSEEAQRTIEDQIRWYEIDEKLGSADLADRWLDKLEAALTKLAASPHRHGLAPEQGRWHPELEIRQMQFRPWKSGVGWRVLFVIDEEQRMVTCCRSGKKDGGGCLKRGRIDRISLCDVVNLMHVLNSIHRTE